MNLSAPPRPRQPIWDIQDHWLVLLGVLVCVFAVGLQWHRHALWFQLSDPNAASSTREAMKSHKETTNPPSTHRGGSVPARHANRTLGHLADIPRSTSLARQTVVAPAGVLYSPARIGGLAPPLDGLARCAVALRGRHGVHAAHLGVGRRFRGAVAVVAEGAVLSGVREVGC